MEDRNQSRQRGTGLREGWRKAPEPERVLRQPRPGARRHALLMAGVGVVGAMAALLFAPQLRVPTEAESGNRSISRTLYPKAPGSPPMVVVPPDQPGTDPETPNDPPEPAAKSETPPAANPPEVVIREVSPPARAQSRRTERSVSSGETRRNAEQAKRGPRQRTTRTASHTPVRRATTARITGATSSESQRLARALNSRAYRLQKQGRHREAEPLLREALRHDPNYAYAQYNLGWALVEQGRGSEAITPLRKTARQQPDRWEPKAKLQQAYRQTGRSERKTVRTTRRRSERRIASTSERSERSTASTRRYASSTRRETRAATSTAGWKGSTDPKEQAFLRAWRDFKTKEEREEDERRRFTRRVSDDLVADPRE